MNAIYGPTITAAKSAGFNPMPMSALDGSRLLALEWSPVHDMHSGARDTVARLKNGRRITDMP